MSLKEPIKDDKTVDKEHKYTKPKQIFYNCKNIENDWVILKFKTDPSTENSQLDLKVDNMKPEGMFDPSSPSFAERSVDYPLHAACVHP